MQFWQPPLLALVGALDESGWAMFSVRGMRHDWSCAHSQDGAFGTVIQMQAWSVIVSVCVCVCVCVIVCVYVCVCVGGVCVCAVRTCMCALFI